MIETQTLNPCGLDAWRHKRHSKPPRAQGLRPEQTAAQDAPLLQSATAALEAGRHDEASHLLETMVQANPCSEQGWLAIARAVDSIEERRFCMVQVLSINRRNALARRELEVLGPGRTQSPLLERAAADMEAGRRVEARRLLEAVLQAEPHSEHGWLWLAEAVDADAERRFCLGQVLSTNRRNALARRKLDALGPGRTRSPLLQSAHVALEAGRRAEARRLLEATVCADPRSEHGWLRLAEVVDADAERRFCLSQVISINHRNALARRGLEALGPGVARSPLRKWDRLPGSRPARQSSPAWGHLEVVREALCRHPISTALGYLAALTAAELLTTLIEPRAGLAMHGTVLMILLLHTALAWGHPSHRLLLSLAFAPLIRLLSLCMPLAGFPLIYWYFIVSVPLFVATALALRTMGLPRGEIGLTLKALPLQILVALTGMSLGYAEYRILQPAPLAQNLAWKEIWLPALILMICTGFAEELIFRGMMQQAVTQALGEGWGILYVAALFAVLHLGYNSLPDVIFVFGVALFFGLARAVTGSIVGISCAHGMTNILLFLTMPLGVNPFDLIAYHLYGP